MVLKNWLIVAGLLFASTYQLTAAEASSVGFAAAVNYAVGTHPQAVVTADFNNDGKLDLAVANHDDGTVTVLPGDGLGGFGAARQSAVGTGPLSLAVADFNKDGKLDLAVVRGTAGTYWNNSLSVVLGNGDGTFRAPTPRAGAIGMAAGDFNNDGNIDLVVGSNDFDSGGYVQVLLGNGRGSFTAAPADWSPIIFFTAPAGLAAGDLNGDGKLDAVMVSGPGGNIGAAFLGNGGGRFPEGLYSPEFVTGPDPLAVAIGDFTGDGIPDLISAGQKVDVLRGHGDGWFDDPISQTANGAMHTGVAVADFNGDGKLDAVTSDVDTGTVSLMLGNGDGTLGYIGALAVGSSPAAVTVDDFNGDGRADMATANGGSNNVSVLLNQSSLCTSFVAPDLDRDCDVDAQDVAAFKACASRASVPVSAACHSSDFDGDGDADMNDFGILQRCYGNPVPNCVN